MLPRFALLVLLAGSGLAQDAARMNQIVESHVTGHHFMGTVLVARGSQVLFSKGYGSADLEWDVPNTPNTKFRLGSVTKQFTAASILLLEERGKLHVTDPVKKYLPDAPAAWDKMTIFHVLTHTAGIPNFTGFADYGKLAPFATTPAELVARFRDKPLDFEPGEQWKYSNSGYVLLGYLIEKVTGQSYEKFLRENIFALLGMKDSGYDSNTAIIAHRASGYTYGPNGFENDGFVHMSVPFSAGALYSTTEDLFKWEQGLFGGKLLQAASLDKMTTPFKSNYAFGLEVNTEGKHKAIEHGGAVQGFNTALAYYPEDKLTVAVLRNVAGVAPAPEAMAHELAAVAHGEAVQLQSERKEITLDLKAMSRLLGAYQFPAMNAAGTGPAMVVFLDGNQMLSRLGSQAALPYFAESETLLFAKAVDAQLEFPKDGDKASQVTLHQNGRDIVAKRIGDAEAKPIVDAAMAAAQRFKDQKPAPGGEAALRKLIEGTRSGNPDYDMMSAGLAGATRAQLPQMQANLTRLGAIQSVTFTAVGPAGPDIYRVKFENGSQEWRIWLAPDGKVDSANFRAAQ
jgi:CubicO group peptidase (beta-lactamase class C family)